MRARSFVFETRGGEDLKNLTIKPKKDEWINKQNTTRETHTTPSIKLQNPYPLRRRRRGENKDAHTFLACRFPRTIIMSYKI